MKKKICLITTGMILSLICACSPGPQANENQTAVEPVSAIPAAPEQADAGLPDAANPTCVSDLNHNGIPEELRLTDLDDGQGQQLEIWENHEQIYVESVYSAYSEQAGIFLCSLDGEDFLLHYRPTMYQGVCSYSYTLSSLADGKKTTIQREAIDFDINFGSPFHDTFDPDSIAAFMEEINTLLSHSLPLLCTDANLLAAFEKEGRLYDSLWWLDSQEPAFCREEDKSLLENLKDFQTALSAVQKPIVPVETDGLPITESLEMAFYSGAGAWQTFLLLNPDGSFAGDYSDANADEVSLCQFHGRFGKVEILTDASWLLTLEELRLDTGHPVGEEWEESAHGYTLRCVSSEPYGFNSTEGAALKPGAQFILYSPDAAGHEPGTELYGAVIFQSWMHNHGGFRSVDDVLGRWGLQNLETGQGFFEDSRHSEFEERF